MNKVTITFFLLFLFTPNSFAQDNSSSSSYGSSVLIQEPDTSSSSDSSSSSESSEESSESSENSSSESSSDSSESSSDSSSSEPQVPVPIPEGQTCAEERDDAYQFCVDNTQPNTDDRIDCEMQKLEYDHLYCPCDERDEDLIPQAWCSDVCETNYTSCALGAYSIYQKCILNGGGFGPCNTQYIQSFFNPISNSGCSVDYFFCKNPPPPPPCFLASSSSNSSCDSSSSYSSESSSSYSSESSSSYSSEAYSSYSSESSSSYSSEAYSSYSSQSSESYSSECFGGYC